jgi:hypothetical protein
MTLTNVIFARTRHYYAPYGDVYRLAELSGYPVQFIDEISLDNWRDPRMTIIGLTKHPEWDAAIPSTNRARFVWWTFERGVEAAPLMDMSSPYIPPYVDEVWASDRAYAKHIGAKYVFLGGHRAFGSVDVQDKRYDIVTLMYYSGRRQRLTSELQGYRLADTHEGLWGNERHERLMQTRLMLSAHQDDKPYSEPIRFMIAGCYALPLLSETCEDSGYWKAGKHYSAQPLDSLTDHAAYLLGDPVCLARYGAAAWRLCCVERDFKSQVEEAL